MVARVSSCPHAWAKERDRELLSPPFPRQQPEFKVERAKEVVVPGVATGVAAAFLGSKRSH